MFIFVPERILLCKEPPNLRLSALLELQRRVWERCRPPIPPQGIWRNERTFASANHTRQNAATVSESAGRCFATTSRLEINLLHFPFFSSF